jgi:rhodanese-related sulfurtransferase
MTYLAQQSAGARRIAAAISLVSAVVGTAPAVAQQPVAAAAQEHGLSRAQIDALLAKPSEILVLDVRRADEISTIGGFPVYLSIQLADLERSLAFIPRDRTILTVSNHAARAQKAAALLASNGFRVAGAAGAQNYAAEGGTLTGQKPVGNAKATSLDPNISRSVPLSNTIGLSGG